MASGHWSGVPCGGRRVGGGELFALAVKAAAAEEALRWERGVLAGLRSPHVVRCAAAPRVRTAPTSSSSSMPPTGHSPKGWPGMGVPSCVGWRTSRGAPSVRHARGCQGAEHGDRRRWARQARGHPLPQKGFVEAGEKTFLGADGITAPAFCS